MQIDQKIYIYKLITLMLFEMDQIIEYNLINPAVRHMYIFFRD